ncbi:Uncharacterised protein [Chlamydia trachomatis]|nr:Uncharacterised protein [Chlamydia trachomatis]
METEYGTHAKREFIVVKRLVYCKTIDEPPTKMDTLEIDQVLQMGLLSFLRFIGVDLSIDHTIRKGKFPIFFFRSGFELIGSSAGALFNIKRGKSNTSLSCDPINGFIITAIYYR